MRCTSQLRGLRVRALSADGEILSFEDWCLEDVRKYIPARGHQRAGRSSRSSSTELRAEVPTSRLAKEARE